MNLDENKKKRVAFYTLGCRLNFSETGNIADGFRKRNFEIVDFGEPADVVFINTCTVTDGADSTCRNLIRRAHKSSPGGKIVVAGCYAQMDAPAIAKMTGVDLVLGTTEKYKVFDYLDEEQESSIFIDKTSDFYGAATTSADGEHTRAFLKIQDGCNYVCSFCIIPQARGRSRAISISRALETARNIIDDGFKEIVLTGVNIGEYEHSSGERLVDLVSELLRIEGLSRLRLSSVEPNTLTDELLDVLQSSHKFQDHFHIPLQSGSDEVLCQMKRRYNVRDYERTINRVIERFPNAGIGADVICGFPGETKEQFMATYKLMKDLPLTHFHVFPYSKRKGTTAGRMDNHIQHGVKKERVRSLISLGEAKLNLFAEDQVNTRNKVLFERKNEDGLWQGHTSNYLKIELKNEANLKNQIREVYISSRLGSVLRGELLQ